MALPEYIWIILITFIVGYLVALTAVYFLHERTLFRGIPLPSDFRFQFENSFREIFLDTPGGGRINIVHFTQDEPKGLILYYHGNKGNLERWGVVVKDLLRFGYELAIMDYRGYGKSLGKRTESRLLSDAVSMYDHFEKLVDNRKILLFGRSLGTGMASYVASKRPCRGIILESPYFSLSSLIQSKVLVYPAAPAIRFRFESYRFLKEVEMPIYVFHGTWDLVVPYSHGKRLVKYLTGKDIKMYAIKYAGHNDLASREEYWEGIDWILNRPEILSD